MTASTRGRILALDLSLTATGVCYWDGLPNLAETFTIRTNAGEPMGARLAKIVGRIQCTHLEMCNQPGTEPADRLVVIEDYALHGPGDKGKTGMVHGVVRMMLWGRSIPTLLVSPSTLKKFATGKGNSGKPAMLAEAIKRLGFDGHDDNEVDARWLWELGAHVLGEPTVDLPQTHLAALDKLDTSAWLLTVEEV